MNRRKTLLVQHHIQWHYLKVVLLAISIPALLSTACLYYLIWQTVAHELAIPELIAEALLPAYERVNQIVLFGMPIFFAVIFLFAIQLSHQLAGPLYRIEQDLEEMLQTGDFSKHIKIRPKDQLHHLVAKINQVLRRVQNR